MPVRPRHDGWTPGKQVAFINALAETACVDEACRRGGMSQQSAYTLRTRPDAVSFRQAWVVALDHGAGKLADRAMARQAVQTRDDPDGLSVLFKRAVRAVAEDAIADAAGGPRPTRDLLRPLKLVDGESTDADPG